MARDGEIRATRVPFRTADAEAQIVAVRQGLGMTTLTPCRSLAALTVDKCLQAEIPTLRHGFNCAILAVVPPLPICSDKRRSSDSADMSSCCRERGRN